MFELGMRIAFDLPVIIVTDDETGFSFDVSQIKHIIYPRSLHYQSMLKFKNEVSRAIVATVEGAGKSGRSGYLQQFGPITVSELKKHEVSPAELAEDVQDIRRLLKSLDMRIGRGGFSAPALRRPSKRVSFAFPVDTVSSEALARISQAISVLPGVLTSDIAYDGKSLLVGCQLSDIDEAVVEKAVRALVEKGLSLSSSLL